MAGGPIALPAIVGRGAELEQIRQLLELDGSAGLVIEGEAGIGKTTLWLHGVEEARRRWTVLVARPAEGETSLPFAALGDLLEPVLQAGVAELPDAQREVLDLALQRAPPGEPASRLALSRAVLELLRRLAARNPLLVAIDDVQWLDAPTEQVLEFAFRRVAQSPVRMLIARRAEQALPLPLGLDRASPPGGIAHLKMGPLTLDEVGGMLRDQLGLGLARPRLVELHLACGGNPFYALEIGRALLDTNQLEDGQPLPVPDRGALLHRRLEALSEPAQLATLLAAASSRPTTALVERAAGGTDGLAEAVRAAVLEVEGDRLRFTHPLLASTTYSAAPPWERREAHARLARAADTKLERAHHLARSTTDPDETVATELAEAAAEAAGRGAPEAAGSLMERAAQLTPPEHGEESRRRLVEAAQLHVASGDPARSRAILERLVSILPAGRERADVLWQLADVGERFETSIRLCEQALEEAGGEPALSSQIQIMLATLTWLAGDLERAVGHSRAGARLAEQAGDDLVMSLSLADLCHRLMMLGLPYAQADMERALELELRYDTFPAFQRPSFQLGIILGYTDSPDAARPLLQAELARLESAGNESWQIAVLFRLADVELRAGNWVEATRLARGSMSLALHSGIPQERTIGLMIHGLVQAHVGNLDEAREAAGNALALAEEGGDKAYAVRAMGVLGFAELSRGDAAAALEYLSPATAELRRIGVGELSISQVVQNEIEALVALGRLDEADETIAFVEEKGRPTGRAWHEAVAQRGRALVASARGDFDSAREHLDRALAAHERLPQPFELGRTLLAQGAIERRARHRGAARVALTGALELFDQLGAPLWAEKAAAELARIPGRAAAAAELSETERRVAELVASGLSNKEVAAKLFVTVRTVEGNLTRIYAKLGVRSRTELAARLGRAASSSPS